MASESAELNKVVVDRIFELRECRERGGKEQEIQPTILNHKKLQLTYHWRTMQFI